MALFILLVYVERHYQARNQVSQNPIKWFQTTQKAKDKWTLLIWLFLFRVLEFTGEKISKICEILLDHSKQTEVNRYKLQQKYGSRSAVSNYVVLKFIAH